MCWRRWGEARRLSTEPRQPSIHTYPASAVALTSKDMYCSRGAGGASTCLSPRRTCSAQTGRSSATAAGDAGAGGCFDCCWSPCRWEVWLVDQLGRSRKYPQSPLPTLKQHIRTHACTYLPLLGVLLLHCCVPHDLRPKNGIDALPHPIPGLPDPRGRIRLCVDLRIKMHRVDDHKDTQHLSLQTRSISLPS